MRIIQPGQGSKRNVLVGFYTQATIGQMATLLGPSTMVLNVDDTKQPLKRAELRDRVRVCGGDELGEVCLIGWSAGCHGVRDNLRSVMPEICIPLDGTHGSIPQPGSMPLQPWRDAVAMARREELLLVVSHTYLLYTDHLPVGQRYESTAHVLREITGWDLPEPSDPAVAAVRRDRGLVVYSWQSGDVDGGAHVRQVTHAGPLLVADWLASRWLGDAAPATSAETLAGLAGSVQDASAAGAPPRVAAEPSPLAAGHLALALAEIGVHEIPGAAASTKRIDEYLACCLRSGHLLGLRGDSEFSWCAAFASWCGLPSGMTPRAAVVELVADAKSLGLWRDNSTWHDPQPGDLAIYATGGVPHHVNRVELAPSGGAFGAVGGNEGDAVRRSSRKLTEPVGWIRYSAQSA